MAQKSGLSWRGKHILLLSGEAGSMCFLGELYTDPPLPIDNPGGNYCGRCSKCIDIRPTQEGDGYVARALGRRFIPGTRTRAWTLYRHEEGV